MINVEFGYFGKAATKVYEYGKSIKDCNLGDRKPDRAIITGEDMSIDKVKLKKWIATIQKAIAEDALLHDGSKVGKTKKKEVKDGHTGEGDKGTESLQD